MENLTENQKTKLHSFFTNANHIYERDCDIIMSDLTHLIDCVDCDYDGLNANFMLLVQLVYCIRNQSDNFKKVREDVNYIFNPNLNKFISIIKKINNKEEDVIDVIVYLLGNDSAPETDRNYRILLLKTANLNNVNIM